MPVHDWALVDASIFHDFHHSWISDFARTLNGLLPDKYYALIERQTPDFLPNPETAAEFYRRIQSTITVRHEVGDRIVAMVEIVSPDNKTSRKTFRSFVKKAIDILQKRIHLLIIDLHPTGWPNPNSIHAAIWKEITGEDYHVEPDKPLTLASYESAHFVSAYVEPFAVGDVLAEMPLFLEPGAHVEIPLEATYGSAFAAVPRRWQRVLDAPAGPTK